MAKFGSGEKASKKEADRAIRESVIEHFDGRMHVMFASDSGGSTMDVYLEVEDTSILIEEQLPDFPIYDYIPKWMGWRCVFILCPKDYIGAVILRERHDDI